jgi:hypothetical protein
MRTATPISTVSSESLDDSPAVTTDDVEPYGPNETYT